MIRRQWKMIVLMAWALMAGRVVASPLAYTAGHGDVGVGYEDGELHLHWHFGSGAVLDGVAVAGGEYEPTEAYARVADGLAYDLTPEQAGLLWFTGAVADADGVADDIWILPQSAGGDVPFLGWGTDELIPSDWDGPLTYEVVDVRGPGEFSIWQSGTLGSFDVWFSTFDGSGETFTLAAGGHDHTNWGFTAAGVYEVALKATGVHHSDGEVSDVGRFVFAVGDGTVIPEPTSAGWLLLGGLGVAARRWRWER